MSYELEAHCPHGRVHDEVCRRCEGGGVVLSMPPGPSPDEWAFIVAFDRADRAAAEFASSLEVARKLRWVDGLRGSLPVVFGDTAEALDEIRESMRSAPFGEGRRGLPTSPAGVLVGPDQIAEPACARTIS